MNSVDVHHLAAAYALDAVDDDERVAFEAHYLSCAICQIDVAEFRSTMAILGDAQPIEPSDHVGAAVMRTIRETRQLSPVVAARPGTREPLLDRAVAPPRQRRILGLAAAVVLVAGVGGIVARAHVHTPGFAVGLEQVVARPDARVVTLAAPGATSTSGRVTLLWSDDADRAVVIGNGLDQLSADRVYELWMIDGSGPQPAGLLGTAADGSIRGSMPMTGDPSAWAITVEPAGGSPTPSGTPLLQATV